MSSDKHLGNCISLDIQDWNVISSVCDLYKKVTVLYLTLAHTIVYHYIACSIHSVCICMGVNSGRKIQNSLAQGET